MSSRLDDELSRLVSAGVLRQYQADSIRDAADAEIDAALVPVETRAARPISPQLARVSSATAPRSSAPPM